MQFLLAAGLGAALRIALVVAVPAFRMAAATAKRSRSATEVWLFGSPKRTPAGGKQLPTNEKLGRFA